MKQKLKNLFLKKLKYLPVRLFNYFSLKTSADQGIVDDLFELKDQETLQVSNNENKFMLIDPLKNQYRKNCYTTRDFIQTPVPIKAFSECILNSIGSNDGESVFYNFPSGGNLRPLNFFILVENVENMKRDIYLYEISTNSLVPMNVDSTIIGMLIKDFLQNGQVDRGGFYLLISAAYHQTVLKYSVRGLRYIFMEAGHVMQNFYINSSRHSLGVTAIGGFPEEVVNNILGLDTISESVIYCAAIGVKNDT